MTQASADVLVHALDALDRADMPRNVKESVRQSVIAIVGAYGEDDDPQKVAPRAESFTRMLKFLEHAHRWSWRAPAIAVNPEGGFSAIWDNPGVHRWILDFSSDAIQETYLQTSPGGSIEYSSRTFGPYEEIQPPFPIG